VPNAIQTRDEIIFSNFFKTNQIIAKILTLSFSAILNAAVRT
jgi:hypothetical protein